VGSSSSALARKVSRPGWTDAGGWLETETPCTWAGVGCVDGSVDGLDLAGNGLSGPIPPELGSLENLRFLYLWDNALSGPIPPELGDMSSVRRIVLRQNDLTGVIPPELGGLASLDWLMLNDNRFSGTVPDALADLEGLDVLWIHENDLEGPLPLGIAQLGAAIQEEHIAEDCAIRPGNDELHIPDDDAYRAADLDGDGFICGVSVPPGA